MIDRILATLSLLLFVVFLGFLAVYINEIDLWIVVLAVGVLAAYDFIRTLVADAESDANGLSAHERAAQTLENQDQRG